MAQGLTPKQELFVAEYLVDQNATQAAIRAGYSRRTARSVGQENLTKPDIQAAVDAGLTKHLEAVDLRAEDVLRALGRHVKAAGRSDVRDLFDDKGNLRDIKTLSPEAAANIAGFDVVKQNLTSGDGKTDRVIKVRIRDQSRYVEMAARHFKVLTDVVQVTTDEEVVQRILERRKRATG